PALAEILAMRYPFDIKSGVERLLALGANPLNAMISEPSAYENIKYYKTRSTKDESNLKLILETYAKSGVLISQNSFDYPLARLLVKQFASDITMSVDYLIEMKVLDQFALVLLGVGPPPGNHQNGWTLHTATIAAVRRNRSNSLANAGKICPILTENVWSKASTLSGDAILEFFIEKRIIPSHTETRQILINFMPQNTYNRKRLTAFMKRQSYSAHYQWFEKANLLKKVFLERKDSSAEYLTKLVRLEDYPAVELCLEHGFGKDRAPMFDVNLDKYFGFVVNG
ncbi:hypothetical protein HDU76_009875, partial [Blyttiomyces sp. JEL0837]